MAVRIQATSIKLSLAAWLIGLGLSLLPVQAAITPEQNNAALTYLQSVFKTTRVEPRNFDVGTYGDWAPYLTEYNALMVQLFAIKVEVDGKMTLTSQQADSKTANADIIKMEIGTALFGNPEKMQLMKKQASDLVQLLSSKKDLSNQLITQTTQKIDTIPAEQQNPALATSLKQGLESVKGLFNRFYDTNITTMRTLSELLDFMLARRDKYLVKDGMVLFMLPQDVTAFNALKQKLDGLRSHETALVQEKKQIQSNAQTKLDHYLEQTSSQP